jgi:hypothetical protein
MENRILQILCVWIEITDYNPEFYEEIKSFLSDHMAHLFASVPKRDSRTLSCINLQAYKAQVLEKEKAELENNKQSGLYLFLMNQQFFAFSTFVRNSFVQYILKQIIICLYIIIQSVL